MSSISGIGYDAHRLVPGGRMVLGGVEIPGDTGLEGHSDADVLTHAIIDALLGAAGLPDIGQQFPDTDEQWRDADSLELLRSVVGAVHAEGCDVLHVDATILLEAPKLAQHREAIQASLAGVLGIALPHVSIKATTGEGMGFVGRAEGAAAMAVATVER